MWSGCAKRIPAATYEGEVVRVGSDIGLECLRCQRRFLLARDAFRRRLKGFVSEID
jgi:hypothetical protein